MLRRIYLSDYKSFREIDLELSQLSVIIGPNSSGKSNLLDAIQLISGFVSEDNFGNAFENHRGTPLETINYEALRNDVEGLAKIKFEIDVELSDNTIKKVETEIERRVSKETEFNGNKHYTVTKIREKFLRYSLEIEIARDTGGARVKREELIALKKTRKGIEENRTSRKPFIWTFPLREKRREKGIPFIVKRIEGRGKRRLSGYPAGLPRTMVSTVNYDYDYPHISVFREEIRNWKTYYLEPRSIMKAKAPITEKSALGSNGEGLPAFINLLKSDDRYKQYYKAFTEQVKALLPNKPEIDIIKDDTEVEIFLIEKEMRIPSRLISEGTLRVMGMLSVFNPVNPSTLICFEEPENGIHPYRLSRIAELIKNFAKFTNKQIIITTHSPLLPTYFDNSQLFVSKSSDGESVIEAFGDVSPLFCDMKIDEALRDRIIGGELGG